MIHKGDKLGSRYKIIEQIGEGGMGQVFLAFDLILERNVAIKVLKEEQAIEKNVIKRFEREAEATTRLNHPNIVSAYDVSTSSSQQQYHYIVMEYIDGITLRDYITTKGNLSYSEATDILKQLVDAIAHAHENGIIHRDIKSQNVMITKSGVVKLNDFGIALAANEVSLTQTNSILGTAYYLSPEQVKGEKATEQSDIYALGILYYEMLTGNLPFKGDSVVEVAMNHLKNNVPSVREFNPVIPQSIENILKCATAKRKENRYKTALEMKADLETAFLDNRTHEKPVVFSYDTLEIDDDLNEMATEIEAETKENKKSKKRKRIVFILVGLIALFSILAAFILLTSSRTVEVPNIVGMKESQAEEVLKDKDLQLGKITEKSSNEIPQGSIISSSPREGRKVAPGSRINIVVSTGKEEITIADFENSEAESTISDLKKQGFKVVTKEEESDKIAKGYIISQTPKAGTTAIPDETVIQLVVSTGPHEAFLESYVGQSIDELYALYDREGIDRSGIIHEYKCSDEHTTTGTITKQEIVSGEGSKKNYISKNSSVKVEISTGACKAADSDGDGWPDDKDPQKTETDSDGNGIKDGQDDWDGDGTPNATDSTPGSKPSSGGTEKPEEPAEPAEPSGYRQLKDTLVRRFKGLPKS